MKSKTVIYLADLTHDGLILSSNVFPLSIGLIGAYLLAENPHAFDIKLFKYPADFSRALETEKPDLIGFANYSWNFHLGYQYTRQIKQRWPEIPVIFGGPNYGLKNEEIRSFWQDYNLIDFYIVHEGEKAFLHLVYTLLAHDMKPGSITTPKIQLPNCHYKIEDEIIIGPDLPRLKLNTLPSPYLMGLMDKFFDGRLSPMIHTTRGCPFQCTFCTEGSSYYNKVEQRIGSLQEELNYIAQRVCGTQDLFITDANFGMFKDDIEKAELFVECQKKYSYPHNIHVSTGKNRKERVIEIAKLLDGSLNMGASLQSTNPKVLANVSRSNISLEKLTSAGKLAKKANTETFSEIILGLPGDSIATHRQSLRDCVEANFDNIRMYQLIMLPQTELNTPKSRRQYNMRTMHRIMPRSFGRYQLANQDFIAVESEEILVESSSLPFDDYVDCREMDLTVEILHNGKVYAELQSLCQILNLSWFDFILRFFKNRRNYSNDIRALYDDFRNGTMARLWKTRSSLEQATIENFEELLSNQRGTNEMSSGKAAALLTLFDSINSTLFNEMQNWLIEQNKLDTVTELYLKELQRFSHFRKQDILNCDIEFIENFSFDISALEASQFKLTPKQIKLPEPRPFRITHKPAQRKQIAGYIKEFNTLHDGLGKMLMRYPHVHRIFRHTQPMNQ